jgi:hypothetical protein
MPEGYHSEAAFEAKQGGVPDRIVKRLGPRAQALLKAGKLVLAV